MGEWMRRHGRSIYSCTQAPKEFPVPDNCRLTYNPATNRIYVHVYAWPYRELHLPGFAGKVKYAQLLNDASELPMIEREEWQDRFEDKKQGALILQLPVHQPNVTVPVVELFLK
jgi:alpha-L-fucosidase